MQALTVRSPWAWAIARGWKPIENRGRAFPRRLVGVPLALHAGIGQDHMTLPVAEAAEALRRALTDADPMCARGAVLAVVRFGVSHPAQAGDACTPWHVDGFGWHWPVESVTPLTWPVPCTGQLGFWHLPGAVLAAVQAATGNRLRTGSRQPG